MTLAFTFLLLLLSYAAFLNAINRNNKWGAAESLLAIFYLTTFVAPGFYFSWFEFSFSEQTMIKFHLFGVVSCFLAVGCLELLVSNTSKKSDKKQDLQIVRTSFSPDRDKPTVVASLRYYMTAVTVVVIIWGLINFRQLPIYGWFSGEHILRPDSFATVPYFYSFSTILYLILPSFAFYLYDKVSWRLASVFFLFAGVGLVAGGHRGVLAFYLIFIWWFLWNKRIDWRALSGALVAFLAHSVNLWVTREVSLEPLSMVLKGVLRLFVEQARGFPARIEMVSSGFDFQDGISIKRQVAQHFWPSSDGTMPTACFGDLYVHFGWGGALLGLLVVLALVFGLSWFFSSFTDTLYYKWMILCLMFLLFSAEISLYSTLRVIAVVGNFYLLSTLLSKIKLATV